MTRAADPRWVYNGGMPKMQVYLPNDLYDAVKQLGLPASSLLQNAVRAEVARRAAIVDAWAYVEEVEAESAPSPSEIEEARAWAHRVVHGSGDGASR